MLKRVHGCTDVDCKQEAFRPPPTGLPRGAPDTMPTISYNSFGFRSDPRVIGGIDRLELASWGGMTPTPWASGDTLRNQGIGRDGPAWIRAQLIQMAWRWVWYQPDSALSEWFEQRTAGARGRIRRVMIVALARKLLIALWRFSETGLVPTGAKLA